MSRFALLSLLLLAACGGGNDSPSPQPLPLQDTTPPVITLAGDNPQVITTGSAYSELGATATDNLDGNLTSSIVVDASSVDTLVAGNYSVTYNVSDTAGNAAATVTRTVTVENPPPPAEPQVSVTGDIKKLVFSWADVDGAEYYRLLENADGHSGFIQVGDDIAAGTLTASRDIAVHLADFVNGQYIIEACNVSGCTSSDVATATSVMLDTIGYFKASNTEFDDHFGRAALSGDGNTLAVAAVGEDSNSQGINGDQSDNSAPEAGAVYVFRFDGSYWIQQAYIKASNTEASPANNDVRDWFGHAIALSEDGNTLAVGASGEGSSATGINGDQSDNSSIWSGAVYLFRYDGTDWNQQAYVKASNTEPDPFVNLERDRFGSAVALSADGNTLAVGAPGEGSSATGVNGDQADNSESAAGAVYLLRFDGTDWRQQAYIKASNTEDLDLFGAAIDLSSDGNTLAVGAYREDSNATGINGDQDENSASRAGAVYVFRFNGTDWSQQAYVKASNAEARDDFGDSVKLSADGNTLAVGASSESGGAVGVNGDQSDNSATDAGAVYVFRFDGTDWDQQAYVKASNAGENDRFGIAVALSADGNMLAVGAAGEGSNAMGVNGDQNDDSAIYAGAVYSYRFDGANWTQQAYIKSSNPQGGIFQFEGGDGFGGHVSLSDDGNTLAVGAVFEDSNATGINGDQNDDSSERSGAVYLY